MEAQARSGMELWSCLASPAASFILFSFYVYFDITEIDDVNTNELYNASQLYLSSSVSISGIRLSLTRVVTFDLAYNDSVADSFNGATVLLEHVVSQRHSQTFSWNP
ncbi:unnamed protein product [Linum tenue]|uniref:AAA-type ATPase N-terminal domain-containing protein n=1 Tax=Linum tenue TaxID=586396 RepID=A0AAV0PIP9_9ROSI|nr:unnamed protein product [Linum tenue]